MQTAQHATNAPDTPHEVPRQLAPPQHSLNVRGGSGSVQFEDGVCDCKLITRTAVSRNMPRTDLGWWTIEQKKLVSPQQIITKKCFVEKLDNVAPSLWSTPLVTGSPRFPHRARKPCCEPTVPQQAHTMQVIDVSSNRLGFHSLRGKVHSVGHRTTPITQCTQYTVGCRTRTSECGPATQASTCGPAGHHLTTMHTTSTMCTL